MNLLTPVGVWAPGPQGCRVRTEGRGPGRLTPNSFTETESEHWGQEEGVGQELGAGGSEQFPAFLVNSGQSQVG